MAARCSNDLAVLRKIDAVVYEVRQEIAKVALDMADDEPPAGAAVMAVRHVRPHPTKSQRKRKSVELFDHLIDKAQQRLWDRDAEFPRRFEVH